MVDFSNVTKDLKAAAQVLAILKKNNITVAQVVNTVKDLEPVAVDFGVVIPPAVNEILTVLGELAGVGL
jgi:hypothetical protein